MAFTRSPRISSVNSVGVARRSYQFGYQKGNSGTGAPQSPFGPKPLKTPAFKKVRQRAATNNVKGKQGKQEFLTFGFGDTGLTRGDEIL